MSWIIHPYIRVGNDFFSRGGGGPGGGFGPRAQGGIRGVDFWTQK